MSEQDEEDTCTLIHLSDCVMITLLSYLDATSLYQLSRTCMYFENIVKDRRLWHLIDARNEPNTNDKFEFVCDRIDEKTRHLLLKGQIRKTNIIKSNFLQKLSENITVLALEAQKIDGNHVNMCTLPSSLIELSLKKSLVKNNSKFFQYSYSRMPNLRVLILDECSWLESSFLISTAKYPSLEILSIVNCHQLQINLTPYFSVARQGFNNLKVIDCRFTTMSHDFLRGFMLKKSLVSLYFQSMCSYQIDTGVPLFPKIFEKIQKLASYHYKIEEIQRLTIRNSSLYEFKYHHSSGSAEERPESILYEDPYPKCTCKYKKNLEKERQPGENNEDKNLDVDIDDFVRLPGEAQQFICKQHFNKMKSLPDDYIKDYFAKNKILFLSDSSDDSDSDNDYANTQCCMFGSNHGTKMIVMKINGNGTIDNDVYDVRPSFSDDSSRIISIDLDQRLMPTQDRRSTPSRSTASTSRAAENRSKSLSRDMPGPSTSKESTEAKESTEDKVQYGKRKNEDSNTETSAKRLRTDDSGSSRDPEPAEIVPSPEDSESDNEPPPRPHGGNLAEFEPANFFNAQVVFRPLRDCQLGREVLMGFELVDRRESTKKLNLRRLSVRGYRKVDDKALEYMKHLNLEVLDVTYTNITKEGVEKFLSYNPNCRVLHKDFCVCKPRIPA